MSTDRQWFEIRAQADLFEPVEFYIYDEIYDSGCEFYGGVCPAPFVAATAPYRDRDVTLRINSPGGNVFAGAAIANYLRSFPKLSAVVDGLAASAASLIFMAAPKERRSMGPASWLMIHEPSGVGVGPATTLEKLALDLHKISGDIATHYAKDTGQPLEIIKTWMAAETWFNAEEARGAGFVTSVTDAAPVQMNFNLSHFRHPPAALRQNQQIPMNAPTVTACGCQTAPRQNSATPTPTPAPAASPTEDLDAIRAERDALRAEIEKLKQGDKTARKARAVAAIDAAIGTGALPTALREAMIARYEEDEKGTVEALTNLRPPGPGVAPIRARASSEVSGGVQSLSERIAAEPDPRKRMRMRTENWEQLMNEPAAR